MTYELEKQFKTESIRQKKDEIAKLKSEVEVMDIIDNSKPYRYFKFLMPDSQGRMTVRERSITLEEMEVIHEFAMKVLSKRFEI